MRVNGRDRCLVAPGRRVSIRTQINDERPQLRELSARCVASLIAGLIDAQKDPALDEMVVVK